MEALLTLFEALHPGPPQNVILQVSYHLTLMYSLLFAIKLGYNCLFGLKDIFCLTIDYFLERKMACADQCREDARESFRRHMYGFIDTTKTKSNQERRRQIFEELIKAEGLVDEIREEQQRHRQERRRQRAQEPKINKQPLAMCQPLPMCQHWTPSTSG